MAEKRSNIGWWILGIAVIVVPVLFYLIIGGRVDGEEFSPDDFSRRYFSYNIMPIFNICLRGIEYHDKTPVFEQTLLADGYLGKSNANNNSTKRWHLVHDSASDLNSRDFDAKLLVRFLDLFEERSATAIGQLSIWIQWNEEHPDLAKQLWPIVADMARNYLYVELTDIMARAAVLNEDRVAEFEKFMIAKSSFVFLNHADRLISDGNFEDALDLYRKSDELLPSQRAADGRDECLDRLERNGVADVDDVEAEVEEE